MTRWVAAFFLSSIVLAGGVRAQSPNLRLPKRNPWRQKIAAGMASLSGLRADRLIQGPTRPLQRTADTAGEE
jgi:hypothetical protein